MIGPKQIGNYLSGNHLYPDGLPGQRSIIKLRPRSKLHEYLI